MAAVLGAAVALRAGGAVTGVAIVVTTEYVIQISCLAWLLLAQVQI
jgi:hypothetical protein